MKLSHAQGSKARANFAAPFQRLKIIRPVFATSLEFATHILIRKLIFSPVCVSQVAVLHLELF